jgi:hypothetical protein
MIRDVTKGVEFYSRANCFLMNKLLCGLIKTSGPYLCRLPLRWLSHRSGNLQPKTYVKPEAAIRVFELLMMGGVSPETC